MNKGREGGENSKVSCAMPRYLLGIWGKALQEPDIFT